MEFGSFEPCLQAADAQADLIVEGAYEAILVDIGRVLDLHLGQPGGKPIGVETVCDRERLRQTSGVNAPNALSGKEDLACAEDAVMLGCERAKDLGKAWPAFGPSDCAAQAKKLSGERCLLRRREFDPGERTLAL
jgi:hypothetical protein